MELGRRILRLETSKATQATQVNTTSKFALRDGFSVPQSCGEAVPSSKNADVTISALEIHYLRHATAG